MHHLGALMHACACRCYKMPYAGQHEVPMTMKKELLGVCNVGVLGCMRCAYMHGMQVGLLAQYILPGI